MQNFQWWLLSCFVDLVDSDNVSNAAVVSAIIDNLLLPDEQFYEICS